MNRGDAYRFLAIRLEELRGAGYVALCSRIGKPVTSETVRIGSDDVIVETAVTWAGKKHGALRVSATAYGPSTWVIERVDESFVIGPSQVAKG